MQMKMFADVATVAAVTLLFAIEWTDGTYYTWNILL